MLKLIYTDAGITLERSKHPIEAMLVQRTQLLMRAGLSLHLEPSFATLLLKLNAQKREHLETVLHRDATPSVALIEDQPLAVATQEGEFVEVTLKGTWMSEAQATDAGVFMTELSSESEVLLTLFWRETQLQLA